jgi:hypothetical protein
MLVEYQHLTDIATVAVAFIYDFMTFLDPPKYISAAVGHL